MRKVLSARLHTTVLVLGVGQLGGSKDIRPTSDTPGKRGFEMFKNAEGLLIKNNTIEVLIPMPNVQMMVLAPEEVTPIHVAAGSGVTKDAIKK